MYETTTHHQVKIPWYRFKALLEEETSLPVPENADINFGEPNSSDRGYNDREVIIRWTTTAKPPIAKAAKNANPR